MAGVPATISGATALSPAGVGVTVLTVSTTGTAGITASAPAASASTTRWKTPSGVSALAASCTRTASIPSIRAANALPDRVRAGGTAVDDGQERAAVGQFFPEAVAKGAQAVVAFGQDHADLGGHAGCDDAPEGMHQDGFAAQGHGCFGHAVAEPLARTCSHQDHRGDRAGWCFAHAD